MILCCGEALIDMLPGMTANGDPAFVPHPGGAALNMAIALGRLGQPVGLLTGVGPDMFGNRLLAALAASNVDTGHTVQTKRPTTLAFVELTDGHASYSFFDENSAGKYLADDEIAPLSDRVSTLCFGGISLACEPGADTYARLLAREADNRVVMIDPNIRPDFIKDPDRYKARLFAMIERADIVKVSDEDLDWLDPSALDVAEKAVALQSRGPSLVILTRGAGGATAFNGDGEVAHQPAKPIKVVDTVGAGDTFNAGFLAHLRDRGVLGKDKIATLSRRDISEAMAFAACVAAVTVSRAGANPPWAEQL